MKTRDTENEEENLVFSSRHSNPDTRYYTEANRANKAIRYMLKTFQFLSAAVAVVALLFSQALAQDASDLAKKTQNPVADLISVPLQSNFNFGAGFHHNKMIYVLNVRPVIPIKLSDEWNLTTRVIMPIVENAMGPGR